jgi:hypothetical protein
MVAYEAFEKAGKLARQIELLRKEIGQIRAAFRKVQSMFEEADVAIPVLFVFEYCEIVRRWRLSERLDKEVNDR